MKKKQFRLYDIYRYAVSGNASKIYGIESYTVNESATIIVVRFDNGVRICKFAKIEDELRAIVKEINKILGNCRKPGRRKYVNS